MSLTKRQIDAARYSGESQDARCVLWDDDPRGLGLRIFPSGRKAWVLSYRVSGRKKLMQLGDYGVLTLDNARTAAKIKLLAVQTQHADPLAERDQLELAARTGTVGAMFEAYLQAREKDPRRPMKRADYPRALYARYIGKKFGSRSVDSLNRSELREWHGSLAHAPYQANRALQYLKAAFSWRIAQSDERPDKRQDARNPCWGIDFFPETPRKVRLELNQLPKLETAIDAETSDPYVRAYFRFVLATGCRRSEALKLEWRDVTLADRGSRSATSTVTFRDTKTGSDHAVPLSPYAVALLESLKQIDGNPYVFVGHKHGTHLAAPNVPWDRIRKTAGLKGLRIHDLRRTFGSWLADGGFSAKQIGSTLGHKSDITSRVYMSIGDQSKRAAVDAVAAMMKGTKAEVKPLRKSA